jgi:hypothetical protein
VYPDPPDAQQNPARRSAELVALVVRAELEAPPDARELYAQVGMYSWPELERAAILERPEDGERAIRLGPIVGP